jgi:acyl carrier protein
MQERILETIYTAIEQVNRDNPGGEPVGKDLSTALYGSASGLDSLGLINLVVAVEQQVEQNFNVAITLADDRALSQQRSPFSTVQTLADYVAVLVDERQRH